MEIKHYLVRTSSNGVKDSARDLRTLMMNQKRAAVNHLTSLTAAEVRGLWSLSNGPKVAGGSPAP
jgi:hypothetical protein